ncbi:molecular chaperone GrpE [Acidiphilium sp. MT5]|jgi:molecular chaperone GrpE
MSNDPDTTENMTSDTAHADHAAAPGEQLGPEAERDALRDKWLRAEADMANLRARTRREVDDARQYAVQRFATDIVESAENLRRGLDSLPAPQPDEPAIITKMRDGFAGVERSLIATLERHGVTAQDPVGALFDPNLHQAMGEQDEAGTPPGTILQAWSRTWLLNGRLLKPAMVVVAKQPAVAAHGGEAAANSG